MNRTEAIAWMFSLCSHLRRSQAKTLSRIVPAAMETGQLSLAEVGRRLSRHTGAWAKHCIKRVDRLVGGVRIEPAEALGAPPRCGGLAARPAARACFPYNAHRGLQFGLELP
jgi:hypothetical protein